ncbi:MAG: patatin-like phospholipase family protein [Roseovarius sp.]|nr:patatin-like phospholipase family protein [Roseovarius sp.]
MTTRSQAKAQAGLVLQGGGARGAYQVGALKAIAEITGSRRNPFPIISGASVGAINAAPLAAASMDFQRGVKHLETLWHGLSCDSIYETRPSAIIATSARWLWTLAFGGLGVGDPCALLDNRPLSQLLQREFQRDGIARAIRQGALRALCITASSYNGGEAVTFFEAVEDAEGWQRARRLGVRTEIQADHLMASTALPFIFAAVRVENQYFGDGSLRLTAPLSPAIRMGADRLLVIGARDGERNSGKDGETEEYPSIGDMGGHALDILFNDNLDADIERLHRINKTVQLLSPKRREESGLRFIDLITLQPSRDLRHIAGEHAHEMPRTIRLLLRSIGSWGKDGRLVSYLLFEPGYVGALIRLGYEDTMKRRDELREFLRD